MRSAVLHTGLLCLLFASCGDDEGGFELQPPGRDDDGGSRDDGGGGGDGPSLDAPSADVNPEGPVINITAPAEGGLVFRGEVLVEATVLDESGPGIDPSSVKVRIMERLGDPPLVERRMDLADTQRSLWSATVSLGNLPDGLLQVVVIAADTDDPPNVNQASRSIRHDTGPFIQFLAPSADDQYFNTGMTYSFRVLYSEGTEPENCSFDEVSISDEPLSPELTVEDPCTYSDSVDFEDDFDPDLIDNQYVLLVRAHNAEGTTSTAQRTFYVDNTGPTIKFEPPLDPDDEPLRNDAIIGGTIDIRVKVTDPSGVVATSVVAEIERGGIVPLLPQGGDVYSAPYDTSELDAVIVSPTIRVTAEDAWGNLSSRTILVHIDNCPPVISLHPPPYRQRKETDDVLAPTGYYCSHDFDPVGSESADDPLDPPDPQTGEFFAPAYCQPQVFFLRARVQDEGNQRPGQRIVFPSQVVSDSVELFAYPGDGPEHLLVDLDGDSFCDDINPSLEPTPAGLPGEAWHANMNPVEPRGTANFTPDPDVGELPIAGVCDPGADDEAPVRICPPTALTIAAHQDDNTTVPVIYSLGEPTVQPPLLCSGSEFDARGAGFDTSQWLCFAVRARDAAGNVGISDEMRVYVDLSQSNWCPSPPALLPAPSCTDGCTFRDWPEDNVFPPFPQKFIRPGQPGFPFGEITDG